jgi:hypothetical protein
MFECTLLSPCVGGRFKKSIAVAIFGYFLKLNFNELAFVF